MNLMIAYVVEQRQHWLSHVWYSCYTRGEITSSYWYRLNLHHRLLVSEIPEDELLRTRLLFWDIFRCCGFNIPRLRQR